MKRLYIDEIDGETVVLTDERHKHLSIVLRARLDDLVELSCGDGNIYTAKIINFTSKTTTLKVVGSRVDNTEPSTDIVLYFAIQKGEHNDLTVQKCVELGVRRLVPVSTRFAISPNVKGERLNKIALEAAQQSGRNKVPLVENPITLDTAISQMSDKSRYDLSFFAYEKTDMPDIKTFLKSSIVKNTKRIAILVGAEGGFSQHEAGLLKNSGVSAISLGARILRAETACMAVLTCVMYECAEIGFKQN